MNQTKYVGFGLACARQFQGFFSILLIDFSKAIQFLDEIILNVDNNDNKDAFVLAKMENAHYHLLSGDIVTIKKAIDECQKIIDTLNNVENIIYASFYRVSADYYKVFYYLIQAKANFTKYYQNALLYLACVSVEDLNSKERVERAYDLSLAALLGQTIYNFGELVKNITKIQLMHPIINELKTNNLEWLYNLLFIFNSGSISQFEELVPNFEKIVFYTFILAYTSSTSTFLTTKNMSHVFS